MMFIHPLSQIAEANTLSHPELSRRLNVSNELLEQTLLDLRGIGYGEFGDDTGFTNKCTHYLFSGECASINRGNRRY